MGGGENVRNIEFATGYLAVFLEGLRAMNANTYLDEVRFGNIRVYRRTVKTECNVPNQKIVIEEIEDE